ncbi:MAG: hypothetical protein RIQ89_999, partial [Bacteroidota bacterium]
SDKKAAGEVMDKLEPVWKTKLTDAQKEAIYKTSNAMLKKRIKAFPDFASYYNCVTTLANGNFPANVYADWQSNIDKVLILPSKNFYKYIQMCNGLFSSNTLYNSTAARWYVTTSDYQLVFDSVPKVIFPTTDLWCVSKNDSMVVLGTSAVFYPLIDQLHCEKGTVNWVRAGWKEEDVYAKLPSYKIDVTGSDFNADSAQFFNSIYFKQQPLLGKFSAKILAAQTEDNASYPRFESYAAEMPIKNIVKDVDYLGGFSMKGNRFIGSGNKENKAKLYFYKENKLQMVAASQGFVVRPERITSDNAAIAIYHDGDSIYHPSLTFKYIVADRELALIRAEEGKSKAPFNDSYHQIDMYFDGIYWKIDEPLMNFKMISGAGESEANFESNGYFKRSRFEKMQVLSEVHPMFVIMRYCEQRDQRKVYVTDLAKEFRMPESEVRPLLLMYANYGFLSYDNKEDLVVVNDKLFYYVRANSGKTDYDMLRLTSIINGLPNASLNLLNFEMTMRGVQPINLSDSQNVVLFPKDQEIKMQKNRDFKFAGHVKAGRFDFFGKEFTFEYNNFKILLDNVDSLRLKVESPGGEVDELGRKRLVTVKSVLQNVTGDLIIDWPGNKSGLKNYPRYPIFNSKKDSYVYYDKPSIQSGVYLKDNFHFHLDPFSIDSLDNFTNAGLRFSGEFISAGIFEDFRDTLSLQKDLSLGLVRNTGDQGWPVYAGKGKFTNELSLSNEGLIGDGTIDYLTSTTTSDQIVFLPDSMNADVDLFTNRKELYKDVEYPEANTRSAFIHWEPKNDVMYAYKKDTAFSMFESQVAHNGNLQLRPDGLTGNGISSFAASELESNLMRFKKDKIKADTADFRLSSDNSTALALSSKNLNSTIDFVKRMGEFKSNGSGSYVTFPINEYICFIDQFKWYMDQKEIELTTSEQTAAKNNDGTGINLEGSEFISINSRQDSLRFRAPFAKYSLKDYIINAARVAAIQTADATVVPDSGIVVIEKYAKMRTLNNALIVANNTTKYHSIFNATVDILGRKRYEGRGDYSYVDESNRKHLIKFDNIRVDTSFQTIASGELTDTAGFPLSNKFLFKGTASLAAANQFLTFSGFAKPDFACEKIDRQWIKFSGEINPANIFIPIDNPTSDEGRKLASSLSITSDSTGIYAAFLMPRRSANDKEILAAKGVLTYDKGSNEFRIAPKEKFEKANAPGNYLALNDKKCTVYAEGKLDFGCDFGQLSIIPVGSAINNLNNDSTSFELMVALNFFFNEESIKQMSEYFSTAGTLSASNDVGRKAYEKGLAELVGREKADKLITELNLYGNFKKFPDDLKNTFLFTDVKMVYDNATRSFISKGQLGLGSIDKSSVNKMVNGTIQIIRKRSGDVLNLYLEPENGTWYFFSYTRGIMQGISSNTAFNDAINKVKPEKRVNKEKDKADLEYMLSTDRRVKDFLKKLNPQPVEE